MTFESWCVKLLDWFGVASANPPLVGDLLEEFRSADGGRSRAWLAGLSTEIVRNKLASLQAVGMGLLVILPLTALLRRLTWYPWGDGPIEYGLFTCVAFTATGMVIGRKFPDRRASMATAFVLYALIARSSLFVLNFTHLWSPSEPARRPAVAAATLLATFCAIPGALLFRSVPKTPESSVLS